MADVTTSSNVDSILQAANYAAVRTLLELSLPYMGVYISTPAETTISDANYTKAAGTTTVTNNSSDMDDDSSTNNRIRYTGTTGRHFHIVAQCTMTIASGTNKNIGVQIWHYDSSAASGSYISGSEARTTIASTAEEQITTHGDVMLDQNDYLEIHVANKTDTVNVTAQLGYLFAMGMLP